MLLGHSSGMWTRLTGVLAAVTVQHADAKDSPGFGGSVAIDKKSNSVVQMPEVHRGYWVIYHACSWDIVESEMECVNSE